ncbi:short-chain dehydrogenase [Aspergillus bombycis]|uniref:Short-chain dehydrogenase n=1 Tax=Aspergillus bombycis TaxID=109264 RepID=A0A1F8A9M0_9EURO|nr:short-chain dehydrogenase [Aspergillus bombycis]OGM48460.1 short-chain dehydrogenase [Aspergillus bombycis]
MSAKTIIVTGASRGIGLAIAKYLLTSPQSHNVVVIARSVEPLQKLKEQYTKQVEVLNGDLADLSIGQKAVDLALKSFGRLDGMVLNHGVLGQVGKIAEADPEQWKQGFDVNFISFVAFIKAGLPALRETKGKLVFTSSGAAVSAYRGWGLYGATKAAMNHLALTLGEEEPDRELREDHATTLEPQVHSKFTTVHKDGKLLKPEQPGHVMAKLVLDGPKELSGKFLSWNDKALDAFQA